MAVNASAVDPGGSSGGLLAQLFRKPSQIWPKAGRVLRDEPCPVLPADGWLVRTNSAGVRPQHDLPECLAPGPHGSG